jgi:hypothetical protein
MKIRLVLLLAWISIALLSFVIWLWMGVSILFNIPRAISMAVAYDRLGNAAMGQGDRETISSWSGRNNGWQERFINWLFFHLMGETNHCDKYREG